MIFIHYNSIIVYKILLYDKMHDGHKSLFSTVFTQIALGEKEDNLGQLLHCLRPIDYQNFTSLLYFNEEGKIDTTVCYIKVPRYSIYFQYNNKSKRHSVSVTPKELNCFAIIQNILKKKLHDTGAKRKIKIDIRRDIARHIADSVQDKEELVNSIYELYNSVVQKIHSLVYNFTYSFQIEEMVSKDIEEVNKQIFSIKTAIEEQKAELDKKRDRIVSKVTEFNNAQVQYLCSFEQKTTISNATEQGTFIKEKKALLCDILKPESVNSILREEEKMIDEILSKYTAKGTVKRLLSIVKQMLTQATIEELSEIHNKEKKLVEDKIKEQKQGLDQWQEQQIKALKSKAASKNQQLIDSTVNTLTDQRSIEKDTSISAVYNSATIQGRNVHCYDIVPLHMLESTSVNTEIQLQPYEQCADSEKFIEMLTKFFVYSMLEHFGIDSNSSIKKRQEQLYKSLDSLWYLPECALLSSLTGLPITSPVELETVLSYSNNVILPKLLYSREQTSQSNIGFLKQKAESSSKFTIAILTVSENVISRSIFLFGTQDNSIPNFSTDVDIGKSQTEIISIFKDYNIEYSYTEDTPLIYDLKCLLYKIHQTIKSTSSYNYKKEIMHKNITEEGIIELLDLSLKKHNPEYRRVKNTAKPDLANCETARVGTETPSSNIQSC